MPSPVFRGRVIGRVSFSMERSRFRIVASRSQCALRSTVTDRFFFSVRVATTETQWFGPSRLGGRRYVLCSLAATTIRLRGNTMSNDSQLQQTVQDELALGAQRDRVPYRRDREGWRHHLERSCRHLSREVRRREGGRPRQGGQGRRRGTRSPASLRDEADGRRDRRRRHRAALVGHLPSRRMPSRCMSKRVGSR